MGANMRDTTSVSSFPCKFIGKLFIGKPNYRGHKREHSRKKVRAMRNNLYANAPGHIHVHRVQRRSQKLVSSVDNLLGLTVFGKLQHSKWTDGCVPVQPILVIQNCLAVSVVGTW